MPYFLQILEGPDSKHAKPLVASNDPYVIDMAIKAISERCRMEKSPTLEPLPEIEPNKEQE
jgi:hypothetical protein